MGNADNILRKRRLAYNTISSLIYQIVAIVSGFIVPRLILTAFGSEVNGLVNSITQFLGVIAFLELGVGAVVESSLYKPLADHDDVQISRVIKSANKFFRTLARILLGYVAFLIAFYPFFANQNFGFLYTATLIMVISISLFAQYYFGIVNRLLVTADQRGYVQYTTLGVAVTLNTLACYVLIELHFGIQVVKLASSVIFLLQPLAIYLYVKRHYHLDMTVTYEKEPIKQKWNGIAQHVAAVILDGTDIVVLTIFSTLSAVSIYSVYFLVIKGVKQLFMSMVGGIQSLIGELWAKREDEELRKLFSWVEWSVHTGTVFVFGVTAITIVPFIAVYTDGVNDADYIQPLFAVLLVAANAGHCLRLPYNILILAGGHYRQTQWNYIIAATLNIVISIAAVQHFGLIGVAMGTLVAMLYQTVWMAWYDSHNFICWPMRNFFRQVVVDVLTVLLMYSATWNFQMREVTYLSWAIYATIVTGVSIIVILACNYIFYRQNTIKILHKIRRVVFKSGEV